ncbi:MAG: hypothetical protein OEU26_27855, partial [Candidatus Tectomicrobia bacterium]|nr:hypothetical protein [Candidatus Tectomicrobia bacterium]
EGVSARLADSGLPPGITENSALKLLDGTVNRHATMMAYNDIFWLMGMFFLLSVPFLLLLGRRTRPAAASAPPPTPQRS